MKNQEIENWKNECESFQEWFSALGGNIGNDHQMSEAFRRIEAKNVSDSKLYQLLETEQSDIMPEYESWKGSFNEIKI